MNEYECVKCGEEYDTRTGVLKCEFVHTVDVWREKVPFGGD